MYPSLVIYRQHGLGTSLLEGSDEPLQGGQGAAYDLSRAEGLQAAATLLVVPSHQVVDADGGVAVADIDATSYEVPK